MEKEKKVKILFLCRMFLWFVALVATVYWIYWSFHLYTLGYADEHEYALVFRPIFARGLFISLAAVLLSFLLRAVSDSIKKSKA